LRNRQILRRLSVDHRTFAVIGPLAPLGVASDLVVVHRLAISLHPSAVAVCFDQDGLLSAVLAPARQRPCWAHKSEKPVPDGHWLL